MMISDDDDDCDAQPETYKEIKTQAATCANAKRKPNYRSKIGGEIWKNGLCLCMRVMFTIHT